MSGPVFKVEDGVPLPATTTGPAVKGTGLKAVLAGMEAGQSVLVPLPSGLTIAQHHTNVSASGRNARRLTGKSFTTRRVEGGVRIWCVAEPGEGAP